MNEFWTLHHKSVISKTKTFSLVNSLKFKELFDIDTVHDFKPTQTELNLAETCYKEFIQYAKIADQAKNKNFGKTFGTRPFRNRVSGRPISKEKHKNSKNTRRKLAPIWPS